MDNKEKNKEQIEGFIDREHRVMRAYYDLLERDLPDEKLKQGLERLIRKDPWFLDTCLDLADILFSQGEDKKVIVRKFVGAP